MARLARLVIPGLPHHVTQRGNRRQQTFFNDGDYAAYLERMAQWCGAQGVDVWAYCLMPNHVHLVVVPPVRGLFGADGRALLNIALPEEELREIQDHVRTGQPRGTATFLERLEQKSGRVLRPQKPGRPRKVLKQPESVRVPRLRKSRKL